MKTLQSPIGRSGLQRLPSRAIVMRYVAAWTIVCLLAGSPAYGQLLQQLSDEKPTDEEYDPDKPTRHPLVLTPAAEPLPALKYSYFDMSSPRRPANGAIHYYRAIVQLLELSSEERLPEEYNEWTEMEAEDIPLDELERYLNRWAPIFEELKKASQCSYCNWHFDDSLSPDEFFSYNMSEFQQMRNFARMLLLRHRHALLQRDFETAFECQRISYQMSQDIGGTPSLIASLIGLAIAGLNHDAMLEWMEQDDAPNLYWSLATLPRPLVDMSEGIRFESRVSGRLIQVDDSFAAQNDREAWRLKIVETMNSLDGLMNNGSSPNGEWLAFACAVRGYADAQRGLVAAGHEDAANLPVGKVLWKQSVRASHYASDSMIKHMLLPPDRPVPSSDGSLERWGFQGSDILNREPLPITSLLMPAVTAVRNAQLRLTKRIAALQNLEAIREYASRNGRLPPRLNAVRLPLILDPETNLEFYYETDGKRAVLREPAPKGSPALVGRDYVIRLKAQN